MLDSTRLRAELFFIHRELGQVAATRCKNLLDDLRTEATGTTAALLWQALYADCLRVVHCTATADGVIYDLEIDGMRGLLTAAARHYTGTLHSLYGPRAPVDTSSARAFLDQYAADSGPFGRNAQIRWRGHLLCSRCAALGEPQALIRYAQLMWWLIEAACQISGVSLADPHWHGKLGDIEELRISLRSAGFGPAHEIDRRVQVFLSKPTVFTGIQAAWTVCEADPFDVEFLHGEARQKFQQLVDQVTTTPNRADCGRALLVIGSSGAGKTHLLRSFWSYVQGHGRGFAAYAQLYANVEDYTRYLLEHVVESLKQPYSGPHGERTGLDELAISLARLHGDAFVARLARLAELRGEPRTTLDRQINQLVDELLGHPELATFDPDLLRVLLYALDPIAKPRVYKYLCCEDMTDHDRSLIGHVAPRTAREHPKSMIRSLARLAFVTRHGALVLMVDQAELSGRDSDLAIQTFQRALDALLGIVSEVPSTVAVIACLSNLYEKAHKVLGHSTLDRLEKDPPPVRLIEQRTYDDIKDIVGHRLAWLFAEAGAVYHASEPVYPIPEPLLRHLVNRAPRAVLDWCQQFRERCIAAGRILNEEPTTAEPPASSVRPPSQSAASAPPLPFELIAAAWAEAYQASRATRSDRTDDVLALVAVAAKAYAAETGTALALSITDHGMVRLQLSSAVHQTEFVIAVTNRAPARGAFANQIDSLCRAARGAIAIAVRTDEFPSGVASSKAVAQLTRSGGRTSYLDGATLRALVAYQRFQPPFAAEHVDAWKRRDRPVASLPPIAQMFDPAPAAVGNGTTAHAPTPDLAAVASQTRKRPAARARAASR